MARMRKIRNSEESEGVSGSRDPQRHFDSHSKELPDVFRYHQYADFLKDWIAYQQKNTKGFSIRKLALQCQFSVGYLPMVLGKKRPLSFEACKKLLPALHLKKDEQQFFEVIHTLGVTSSQEVRLDCLRRMKRYSKYSEQNPDETQALEYLSHWYYPAIREMSGRSDFRLDAEWIQSQLRLSLPLQQIKDAIEFLSKNSFLEFDQNNKVVPPSKAINCEGGIFRIALAQYHKQQFELAEKSIENASSKERYLIGHTFSIPAEKYERIREMVDELVKEIQDVSQQLETKDKDAVYHIQLALFPITKITNGSQE